MKPGPTGEYPQGKLTPRDDGALNIAITDINGKIVLNFGYPVQWIGFGPEEAIALAGMLTDRAMRVKQKERPT